MPSLTFLGAARTVTGSKYLLQVGDTRVLVDCGLFQGLKELRERNWQPLPVDAASINAVILTHAHLDHSGYLPRLVSQGFRGRIFCTPGTQEICRLVLPDSARLQEEDARQANRHGYSRHQPALPLYTGPDAYRALTQLQPVGYERPIPVAPGIQVEFINAGHLLGSAYARVTCDGLKEGPILFGGDLGRYGRPVLPDPMPVARAHFLLVESTYGNRIHEPDDDGERLAQIVRRTAERGGKVIVPAFAVGRVEEVLYWLRKLEQSKRIPILPVYVDSPMAIEALRYYGSRSNELDPDMRPTAGEVSRFSTERFQAVATPQQSKAVVASGVPAIVISASGMATGGRVLHHLVAALPNARNTVVFVGYQAAGTRGRALVDGVKTVKIHGQLVPVAAEIDRIDSMSAHADASEILRWLRNFEAPPSRTFLVHGEFDAMVALQQQIDRDLGWQTKIPEHLETVELS